MPQSLAESLSYLEGNFGALVRDIFPYCAGKTQGEQGDLQFLEQREALGEIQSEQIEKKWSTTMSMVVLPSKGAKSNNKIQGDLRLGLMRCW